MFYFFLAVYLYPVGRVSQSEPLARPAVARDLLMGFGLRLFVTFRTSRGTGSSRFELCQRKKIASLTFSLSVALSLIVRLFSWIWTRNLLASSRHQVFLSLLSLSRVAPTFPIWILSLRPSPLRLNAHLFSISCSCLSIVSTHSTETSLKPSGSWEGQIQSVVLQHIHL